MVDTLTHGQQVSPDKRSIWIPNMLQSGLSDSSGDNACQALTPPPANLANRKPKAIKRLHQHFAHNVL